ncbi:PulJ/GspJ family protein [Pararhodobacter zhoushanensis]|uniref:Prepilin-type N-terminal cleavage/methylation domain-containing protein n=1 Tax=Pararhodobacter zhoushanensis TaxID=2479545 RepID=A0ABT3GVV3_9RHOB|nr:prepilin-type N-terminal cleavage/methylation domain-containing protein [Pararhodobacter zhoushanensis]MCW1931662.1 prepilin-type N-terminal cleavage/methylation domain-containing protein [Pararhodobacter zhoushanensis]
MRRGFTLIELLVAMAILAVVSIMGVQALSGVFFQREILTRTDAQAVAVIRTLSLLRQDFEAVVPLPATLEETELGLALGDNRITLARGGLAEVPGDDGIGVAVIFWRVEGGALVRGMQGGAARQMLDGVRALSVVQIGREGEGTGLPPGLRLTIETARWGALDVVVVR